LARQPQISEPLANNALKAELAGVAKDDLSRLGDVLAELQAGLRNPTQELA